MVNTYLVQTASLKYRKYNRVQPNYQLRTPSVLSLCIVPGCTCYYFAILYLLFELTVLDKIWLASQATLPLTPIQPSGQSGLWHLGCSAHQGWVKVKICIMSFKDNPWVMNLNVNIPRGLLHRFGSIFSYTTPARVKLDQFKQKKNSENFAS